MRRLTRHDDSGVATIFFVLIFPALLLMGAFVWDGGRAIVARQETQNAADAAALAKAVDCAKNPTVPRPTSPLTRPTARPLTPTSPPRPVTG